MTPGMKRKALDGALMLQTYMERTRSTEESETAAADLMADLMHWCDLTGRDFDELLERATDYYHQECKKAPARALIAEAH